MADAATASKALSSTQQASERDQKEAARYRAFFDAACAFFEAGLPITFLGIDYYDKPSLEAAIDATKTETNRD